MKKFVVRASKVNVVLTSVLGGTFTKCDECGEYHAVKTMEKVDGDFVCKTCLADNYVLCYECNEYVHTDKIYEAYNDGKKVSVCESCRDDDYYYCEDCDTYNHYDDMVLVNPNTVHEKSVCDSCIDSYCECDDCGEYFSENWIRSDDFDNNICNRCFEEYTICDECGRIVSYDDCYCDDDGYERYCEGCYTENNTEKLINSYGFKPDPVFYYAHNESSSEYSTLFMGCELEVDNGDNKTKGAETVKDYLGNHVYNKYDGSLNDGFEIVSHPLSLAYHTNIKDDYRMAFDELSSQGFKSHDTTTCGYHIHVGREYLGNTTQEQDYTISKIALLVELHWNKLLTFSRRKNEEIRWCKKFQVTESHEDLTDIEKISDKCKKQYDRYYALNLQNDNTIEFRLFKGTLKLDTYFACMQLVSNLVNVAKNTSIVDLIGLSFSDIISYENYSELTEYCKAKGLIEA